MIKTSRQMNSQLTNEQILDMIKTNFSVNDLSDDKLMALIKQENLS